jgi:predicted nucleic acid-binding protein
MARGWHLTIDEWFYHWFGETDNEKVELANIFFLKLLVVCDKIVIQRGSRLAKKFHELAEQSTKYPPKNRDSVKLLLANFYKKDKVYIVDEVSTLSAEITFQLPRKDVYLVEICMETNEKIIITTDTTLYQNLVDTNNILGIRVFMAKDFIQSYPDF